MKFKIIIIFLFAVHVVRCQNYISIKKLTKHSTEITAITANEEYFATASNNDFIAVWDYNGKNIYKYSTKNARVDALALYPNSNQLIMALTEYSEQKQARYILKCVDVDKKIISSIIDTTLTQEFVDQYYENNCPGTLNAINQASRAFLGLGIQQKIKTPLVKSGLSHIECIQNISISPSADMISTIDYFRILKLWNRKGKLLKTYQINNNKSHTKTFFISDSLLYITPDLLLNIKTDKTNSLGNFENYMGQAANKSIYLHFDYNDKSAPEKIVDISTNSVVNININSGGSVACSSSSDCFVLIGIDGLVRVVNKNGDILNVLGKDRDEIRIFRGKEIHVFSKICQVGVSSNNNYVITGDENGKVIVWKK